MKVFQTVWLILFLSIIQGWGADKLPLSLLFSGGITSGGIVHTGKIDGVSGATKTGGHAAVHTEIAVFGHYLETGIDYTLYQQDMVFKTNNIDGTRNIVMQSLGIPLTYNFHFFNRANGNPYLVLGLGLYGSYFVSQSITDTGTLGPYQIQNAFWAPTIRIGCFPLEWEGNLIGLYMNIARSGAGFYSDDYYKDQFLGGVVTINLGAVWKYPL